MRKYKVKFYKDGTDREGQAKRLFKKEFFIYNDSYESADKLAKEKLSIYQEQENDNDIKYWMDPIGIRAIANY